jgi:DNA-binding NtrC family response regulator
MECETTSLQRPTGVWDSRYFSQLQKPLSPPRRLVLIDDDPSFLAIMQRLADKEGIPLDCFEQLEDLGVIDLFKTYDAAIIDYDLGDQTAVDISFYLDCFIKELPTLIISAKDRTQECKDLPRCVKSVLRKSAGYDYILGLAVRLSQSDEYGVM